MSDKRTNLLTTELDLEESTELTATTMASSPTSRNPGNSILERYYNAERGRRRTRSFIYLAIFLLLLLIASFATSLTLVYRHLDDKIQSATTVQPHPNQNLTNPGAGGNNNNNNNNNGNGSNGNYTTNNTLASSLTEVVDQVYFLTEKVQAQEEEIHSLQTFVRKELNTTVTELNNTLNDVQNDVNEQVEQVTHSVDSQNSLMAYQFAGTFAILGSLISFWHMASHLRKFTEPFVQRKIIAILWMIPIYSVSSWLGLVIVAAEGYLALIKDLYEAYCIYTFLAFITAVLGRGNRHIVINLLATHAEKFKPPIRFAFWKGAKTFESNRHKAEAVMDQCQLFAMQFVFVRPLTSAAMIVADAFFVSRWDVRYPQFYIMMTANVSIFFAFLGLVKIYHAVHEELKWCHPFAKFLCIKGVVFMTFWQGIVISFIAQAVYRKHKEGDEDVGSTGEDHDLTVMAWSRQAQSFLVCLEMFFFAIIHCFVFPPEEWEEGYREKELQRKKENTTSTIGDNIALNDFFRDVKAVMQKNKRRRKKRTKRKMTPGESRRHDSFEDAELDDDEIKREGEVVETTFLDKSIDDNESIYEVEDPEIDWSDEWGPIEKYIEDIENKEEVSRKLGGGLNDLQLQAVDENLELDSSDVVDLQYDSSTTVTTAISHVSNSSSPPRRGDDDDNKIV